MIVNEYPYTDNHEINLDWLISEMQDLLKKYNLVLDKELHDFIIEHFNQIFGQLAYVPEDEKLIMQIQNRLYADGEHVYTAQDETIEITDKLEVK